MSRRCVVTGKTPQSGNNVSHALNRTRRRFLPNIKETKVYSEVLKRSVRIKLSAAGLRTIDHKGGLDAYVMGTAKTKLDVSLRPIKAQVEQAVAAKKA